MTLAIFLGTLLLCIFTGLPIAFSLLVTAVALMLHLHLFDPQIIALNLVNGVDSFPLMAVPFFLLAGELMNAGGISRRIVALASALVGHFRGGLGYVAIFAGVLMASMSGSAVADTAALGGLLLPMMVRSGYRPERAGGLVASAGIIAPIIPPSVAFVVFGVATNLSIGKLFLAGIAPGVLLSVALAVTWWVMTRNGDEALQEKVSGRERLRILGQSFWALMLPVIVIVGLRAGVFTPTEAAVVAAVYALLVSLFIYREISLGDLMPVFLAGGADDIGHHVASRLRACLCLVDHHCPIAATNGPIGGTVPGQPCSAIACHSCDCLRDRNGDGPDTHRSHPGTDPDPGSQGGRHRPHLLWRTVHHLRVHRLDYTPRGHRSKRHLRGRENTD